MASNPMLKDIPVTILKKFKVNNPVCRRITSVEVRNLQKALMAAFKGGHPCQTCCCCCAAAQGPDQS